MNAQQIDDRIALLDTLGAVDPFSGLRDDGEPLTAPQRLLIAAATLDDWQEAVDVRILDAELDGAVIESLRDELRPWIVERDDP